MPVILNRKRALRLMSRRGWTEAHLVAETGLGATTVRDILKGGPVGPTAQRAIWNAFQGQVRFDRLFTPVLDVAQAAQEAPSGR